MENTPESWSTDVETMRRDAEQGCAQAQFAMGFSFAVRPAVQDYAQALHWYQKAADQNHGLAQFNLAQMYAHGQGMPRSDSMALMWMRRSAQHGDPGAQFDMGARCERATAHLAAAEASESRVECYKWFTLAAAQNYRDAQLRSDAQTERMTREEVTEGNRRVQAFEAGERA